jgi:hypothetical protein
MLLINCRVVIIFLCKIHDFFLCGNIELCLCFLCIRHENLAQMLRDHRLNTEMGGPQKRFEPLGNREISYPDRNRSPDRPTRSSYVVSEN